MCCMHVSHTHPAADPSFDAALCVTQLVFSIVPPSLRRASLWNAMRSHGCCTCTSAHSCTPDVSAVGAWETTEPLCVFLLDTVVVREWPVVADGFAPMFPELALGASCCGEPVPYRFGLKLLGHQLFIHFLFFICSLPFFIVSLSALV